MKKTLSEQYSYLEVVKLFIILSVGASTIFFLISIVEQFLIIQLIGYILFLGYSIGSIMIINFLFKLDETKNNLEGKKTNYYRSGKKQLEGTYKDGEEDGLWTDWYENGQKWNEVIYKDGERVSEKHWNEDGSIKE